MIKLKVEESKVIVSVSDKEAIADIEGLHEINEVFESARCNGWIFTTADRLGYLSTAHVLVDLETYNLYSYNYSYTVDIVKELKDNNSVEFEYILQLTDKEVEELYDGYL